MENQLEKEGTVEEKRVATSLLTVRILIGVYVFLMAFGIYQAVDTQVVFLDN